MRIAIVKLSALGDIVHAMVVLQFIKKFNNEISIDWVVEKSYKELLELNPDINQVYPINLKKAKRQKSLFLLLSQLRKVRSFGPYDIVIDMQGLIKSALISKLIPSKKTFGFDKYSTREKLASLLYTDKLNFAYEKNIIERNIALIEFALNIKFSVSQIQGKAPFLFSKQDQTNIDISKVKKNILLVLGASHLSKCYPVSKYSKLTSTINANFYVIWGNENEKLMALKLKELSPKINICNKVSLDSLIFLISKFDLVIGSDTGPTHISWALNIPSITLFGSTPGYRNTLSSSIHRIIESDSYVNPNKIDKNDYSIKTIDVQDLISVTRELLR